MSSLGAQKTRYLFGATLQVALWYGVSRLGARLRFAIRNLAGRRGRGGDTDRGLGRWVEKVERVEQEEACWR